MLNISSNAAGALVVEQSEGYDQSTTPTPTCLKYGATSIFDGIFFAQGIVDKVLLRLSWVGGNAIDFLAVQDSSIGDLVTHSLTHSVSQRLLISATSEHYRAVVDTSRH